MPFARRTAVFLLVASALPLVSCKKAKKPPPVAIEARFKERIEAKLQDSLDAATRHLGFSLGIHGADGVSGPPDPGTEAFGRYELELGEGGKWRAKCEADIDQDRDAVTLCVMHKLQALTAFCEVPGAAERHRDGVAALLRQLLVKREQVVEGLGIKRSLLPIGSGLEAFFCETKVGSGDYDVSVALHASAMLAAVRCGGVLEDRELLDNVQSWFVSVLRMYGAKQWEKQSFHANSILLEAFTIISAEIRQDSSFSEEIHDFVATFESYLQAMFAEKPTIWSFSGANAAVLRWASEKKAKRKQRHGKAVDEYLQRWARIAPHLNVSETYTCGPLQGVAPMMLKRGAHAVELVSSVIKMAEKDVDLFQIRSSGGELSEAAERVGSGALAAHGASLEGAFLRDDKQLQGEKRWTVRIDDTAQCVMGLSRTLRLLDDLVGVEAEAPEGVEAEAAEPGEEPGASGDAGEGGEEPKTEL